MEKKQDKNAKHEEWSRRAFMVQAAELFAVYSFYQIAHQSFAWAKPIEPMVSQWVKQLDEICNSVHQGKLSPQDWQTAIEQLHAKIPLADVLKFVDLDRVLEKIQYPRERLGAVQNVAWPAVEGFPGNPPFGHKVFVYRKGRCTPPHAHNHLVSAHLIIKGQI